VKFAPRYQLWAEQAAPVRAWLTEIVTHDNKDLSAENIEALMKACEQRTCLSPEKRFVVCFSIYGELRCTQIPVRRHSRQIAFACCLRHFEITCTGAS